MLHDPLGDMLTRIRNAYLARHSSVEVPRSKLKKELGRVLVQLGYIGKLTEKKTDYKFRLQLKYHQGEPAMDGIERVSRPGLRRYISVRELKSQRHGLGHMILSTPKGLKTHIQAIKEGVGGEVLCKVW